MPTAKGALAQKYRAMLVLYFEGSLEQQTLASHFWFRIGNKLMKAHRMHGNTLFNQSKKSMPR